MVRTESDGRQTAGENGAISHKLNVCIYMVKSQFNVTQYLCIFIEMVF